MSKELVARMKRLVELRRKVMPKLPLNKDGTIPIRLVDLEALLAYIDELQLTNHGL